MIRCFGLSLKIIINKKNKKVFYETFIIFYLDIDYNIGIWDLTTYFLNKDGKITAVISDNYQPPRVDTLLKVAGDLSKYPGTAEEKLRALQNPGTKVTVSAKDTVIYNGWGTKAYSYQREDFIISPDSKSLKFYTDLDPTTGQRPAWEIYLLCLYMVLCGFVSYRYKKYTNDALLGIVLGLGIVLVLGLGLGIVLVLGLVLGFWWVMIISIALYMASYFITKYVYMRKGKKNTKTA